MLSLNDWIKLLEMSYTDEPLVCPECGGKIDAQLFARETGNGKIGFAALKCQNCKAHQDFSRVKFPDYVKTQEL